MFVPNPQVNRPPAFASLSDRRVKRPAPDRSLRQRPPAFATGRERIGSSILHMKIFSGVGLASHGVSFHRGPASTQLGTNLGTVKRFHHKRQAITISYRDVLAEGRGFEPMIRKSGFRPFGRLFAQK
jgi:hypothetical protein